MVIGVMCLKIKDMKKQGKTAYEPSSLVCEENKTYSFLFFLATA